MNYRYIAIVAAANLGLLLGGCQHDSTSSSSGTSQPTASKVKIPEFEGVTLDDLKAKLGSRFTLRPDAIPTTLVREADGLEQIMMVNHSAGGQVQSIVCHVLGPDGSDDKMDVACTEVANTLNEVLGGARDKTFDGFLRMSVARTRIGCSHTFINGRLYFSLTPKNTLTEHAKWTTLKPDRVYRDVLVMPTKGSGAQGPGYPPIEEATFAQLQQMLEGFVITTQIEGEQVLFARELDDHTQYVYCELKEAGRLALIEAFVGSVSEGADAMKLNNELWVMLAQFQYKECNPEEVITFLNGPQPDYAVDFSRTVGHAKFYLPLGATGRRDRMMIWAAKPPRKL